MLAEKQINNLSALFKTLPAQDRKLIALRIICYQSAYYGFESSFINEIIKSGLADEKGRVLTVSLYQNLVAKIVKLNFSLNKRDFLIQKELHHVLLVQVSNEEMKWVFSIVSKLYGKEIPDFLDQKNSRFFHQEKSKIRACFMKAVYANELNYFTAHSSSLVYCNYAASYLQDMFNTGSIGEVWFNSRHKIIQLFICIALLRYYYCEEPPICNNDEILSLFERVDMNGIDHDVLHYYSAIIHLSIGNSDRMKLHYANIKNPKSGFSLALKATIAFLENDTETASISYRLALSAIRKQFGSRSYYFDNILGIFHNLCLAYVDKNVSQLAVNADQYNKYAEQRGLLLPMRFVYTFLPSIIAIEKGAQKNVSRYLKEMLRNPNDPAIHPLSFAIYCLLRFVTDENYIANSCEQLHKITMQCIKKNHLMAACIFYELLEKIEKYQLESQDFLDKSAIKLRLLALINIKNEWEYSLQTLEGLLLGEGVVNNATPDKAKRLLWLIDTDKQRVNVIEQCLNRSGQWSAGKAISLNKLKNHHEYPQLNYLTEADKKVAHCIVAERMGWGSQHEYLFDHNRAILALTANTNIAHQNNKEVAIELVRAEPELYIEENNNGYQFALSHWLPEIGLIIEPESLNKYRVIDFSMAFLNIAQVLTKSGMTVPLTAKEKVLRVIQHAKKDIHIHVGIKDIIPEIAGDPTPCIQLLPTKEGVRATLWVRPLPNQGTYCKSAQGKESVMALITENGIENRVRILRDFSLEKSSQLNLLSKCQSLSHHEIEPSEYEINTPEETLETLSELQNYAALSPVVIEWPQGQTFKIKQKISFSNLSLNIASVNNWFEYKGKITLDDGDVLAMQDLLDAINRQSVGRFVRLQSGEFLELTSQLKKQLNILHAISDGNKINALGAQVLSDIVAEAESATFDAGWTAHLKKMQSMKKHAPKVPSTLQATLRDYQIEGFHYLSRLTHWGIGACLADDMGLGKTVQTIALLLDRSKHGPSLVIAPTSVAFNWVEELNKFAPTLNVYNLHSDDRETLVKKAGKFDVIICSYGLLQHNDKLLINKQWETIVLDEAQAIKNASTQRWKNVMALKGKNRIALSGTPIENHLGELWSIFSFINPGLLGSIKSFQNKYSTPIETKQEPDKVHALKTLVSPYILRRLKSEVLTELPPKTEQTIRVEQSEEEAIFYEALRRKTEERMASLMTANNRIGVLAEITKLRQACCDSSLVDKSLSIENSKLNAFIETCKNIIDNGHKALVFSQYVSFLHIVRARIESEKINYQYLDGSTSPVNRKKSVEAFQSGEGDLFLLSLKAGGSGLNLTAADYVIHLDPWWNPAVEDQASDRAHRIGQERPVTIYRFIMQNTIEEKILSMHEHKRNLANELLSGQGISGKLSNEDLMSLITASSILK
ncbi:MAG: DEAD/DEAH box helicase [Gammaproteobacteria bacterium]|nr:DEAD/DEAH box helicase [Gammaproteobacteria bacterium]